MLSVRAGSGFAGWAGTGLVAGQMGRDNTARLGTRGTRVRNWGVTGFFTRRVFMGLFFVFISFLSSVKNRLQNLLVLGHRQLSLIPSAAEGFDKLDARRHL